MFAGWAGGGCSGTAPCAVTMTAARNVVATFNLNTLTVALAGNGLGTVTGTGINCGTGAGATDCTENYNANTVVTLTATAGVNTTFTSWAGGGCSGTGTCMTTMAGAAVNPGDWIPAMLIKPFRLVGPMTKSSPSAAARSPANWAITSFSLMPATSCPTA